MSPEDIDIAIRKEKGGYDDNKRGDRKYSYNRQSDDEENVEDSKMTRKEQLLKMLTDLKKNNLNKSKGLTEAVKTVLKKKKGSDKSEESESESEESEESEDSEKERERERKERQKRKEKERKEKEKREMDKKKKTVKFEDDKKKSEKSDKKSKIKVKVVKEESSSESENNDNDKKEIIIDISPSQEEDPMFYSDYIIDFNERDNTIYNSISNLEIIVNEFKRFYPYINNSCNKLSIISDSKTKDIELDEDTYELEDILDGLTENLEDVSIECKLNDDGYVVIENTSDDIFEINGETESFLSLLGFENKVYKDASSYTAENLSAFNIEKVYVYIPNIDKSKPICSINYDLEVEMIYNSDKVISKLDCVIIQIKDEMTPENKMLHNFCGTPPKLELRFKN
jgi:hypothetical protein